MDNNYLFRCTIQIKNTEKSKEKFKEIRSKLNRKDLYANYGYLNAKNVSDAVNYHIESKYNFDSIHGRSNPVKSIRLIYNFEKNGSYILTLIFFAQTALLNYGLIKDTVHLITEDVAGFLVEFLNENTEGEGYYYCIETTEVSNNLTEQQPVYPMTSERSTFLSRLNLASLINPLITILVAFAVVYFVKNPISDEKEADVLTEEKVREIIKDEMKKKEIEHLLEKDKINQFITKDKLSK